MLNPPKLKLLSCLIIACLFLITSVNNSRSAVSHQPSTPLSTKIAADELYKMIQDGADIVLIDARREADFKEGHIPSAISLPADKVDAESLAQYADNMNKKLVFYCADTNCTASRIGAAKAIGAGYKYVYEFPGGYADWKKCGYDFTKPQLTK